MATRVKASDHLAKLKERGVEIEMDDGQVFYLEHPQLWPDSAIELGATDPIGLARLVLGGNGQYAAFVAAGGSAGLLASIIEDEFGETLPQS